MAEKIVKDSQGLANDLVNDTISRQAAIDAIKKCRNESDMPDMWYDGISCALRCIYQLPSAQPYTDEEIQKIQELEEAQHDKIHELAYQEGKADAMRWIPISEKFPQKDEDVLLQFPSNQGVGYYEDGDWMINTGDGIYSIIGYNEEKPIAWMPLPEPYKGDDK